MHLLQVEDVEEDARRVERDLQRGGWEIQSTRVETEERLREALHHSWDVIVCGHALPRLTALQVLEIVRASEHPDTPFIVVSGSMGEEATIEILRRGASDFINKKTLARLGPAITRELADTQLRREKRAAQLALAEALASREELIAVAGHEFRNPLAALQITIDSLQRSGRAPEHAQALSRQAARLRDLVTRLVDIAALEVGTFELRASDIDLALVASMEARRLDGRIQVDAPAPVPLHADLARLELVVSSLLDNALKFGGREPVTVRVRRDGGGGLLEVADRGPGLDEADHESVFQPFGKRVSSRHFGGFGLSLWLSRAVVERHGGSLVALDNPGGGALFRVCVPGRPVTRNGRGSSPGGPPPPLASG